MRCPCEIPHPAELRQVLGGTRKLFCLAILAVEQIAHGLPACLVRLF
jgi:hypothetical protein